MIQRLSEREDAIGGEAPAKDFFTLLHSLTKEGYFADPAYLGNYDCAGRHMVGFPSLRIVFLRIFWAAFLSRVFVTKLSSTSPS